MKCYDYWALTRKKVASPLTGRLTEVAPSVGVLQVCILSSLCSTCKVIVAVPLVTETAAEPTLASKRSCCVGAAARSDRYDE
jgi:hypothetical protein